MSVNNFKKKFASPKISSDDINTGALMDSLGVTNPYAKINETILEKQVEILENAIKKYERLEDVKKFTNLVLEDIEDITEEELQRALENEKKISINDAEAILALLHNEGFLDDIIQGKF